MNIRNNLIRLISKNERLLIVTKQIRIKFLMYFGKLVSDKAYIKLQYRLRLGKKLNLVNPTLFNEKVQYAKLYYRNPMLKSLVDKYEVRKYVKEKIGEKYLIPLLGKYDNFEQIDFKQLPNQFIIKCNHDSGGYYVCRDKRNFNEKKAKKVIKGHLKRNFYYIGREWQYKNIRPCVLVEKLCLMRKMNCLKIIR